MGFTSSFHDFALFNTNNKFVILLEARHQTPNVHSITQRYIPVIITQSQLCAAVLHSINNSRKYEALTENLHHLLVPTPAPGSCVYLKSRPKSLTQQADDGH